jgi:tRNA-Thr(GGU) m(6)t(6)A37 methyltransferase TsaA
MAELDSYSLHPIGVVSSPLQRRENAPRQALHGAPEAWLDIYPQFIEALEGIAAESEIVLLTWLHMARRDLLRVHPGRDASRPLTGVFATRSPDRPNPIGLHRVRILEIREGRRIRVDHLEAIDGTPIIDIKPVLPGTRDE